MPAGRRIAEAGLPPEVALLLMTGVTQVLGIERALGMTAGHQATLDFIDGAVADLEAPP